MTSTINIKTLIVENSSQYGNLYLEAKETTLPERQVRGFFISPRAAELYDAIEKGNRERVRELLKCLNIADLNSDEFNKGMPLAFAARNGQHEILLDLAKAGASDYRILRDGSPEKTTALYAAVIYGQTKSVELLLAMKANPLVKGRGYDGITMSELHVAAKDGNIECIKLLIEEVEREYPFSAIEYINSRDRNNQTPLEYAFHSDQPEIVDYLIEKGAFRIDSLTTLDDTLLRNSAANGKINYVKSLVSKGFNPNVPDSDGYTSLDLARIYGRHQVVEYLTSLNASSDEKKVRERRSECALITLAESKGSFYPQYGFSGQAECLAALLPIHVNEILNDEGTKETLLHLAAAKFPSEESKLLIEGLLKLGANTTLKDSEERTPFDVFNQIQDDHYLKNYHQSVQERAGQIKQLLSSSNPSSI